MAEQRTTAEGRLMAESRAGHPHSQDLDPRIARIFGHPTAARRGRAWSIAAGTLAVLVVVGVLITASVAAGTQQARLRTARAEVRDVDAKLQSVATIEPVSQAAVAFPTSGTVDTVQVAVGDTVAVGQAMASLDTVALTRTLNQKKEALAQAELILSRALDGESVDDSPGSLTAQPASMSDSTNQVVLLSAVAQQPGGGSDGELAGLQQAVLDAQTAVDASISASDAAVDNATNVCSVLGGASPGASTTSTSTPTADLDACLEAIREVQAAQAATTTAQRTLADASSALDQHRSSTTSSTTPSEQPAATVPQSGAPSGGMAPSSGGAEAQSTSPSAAELVAYQKAVSAAELHVLVATQAIAQATIVAPISGTVVAVQLAPDDEVTAASATQAIIIQGDNGVEVVTSVALSDIASIEMGQSATVVPDGSSDPLEGEVVGIAATPDDDSSTSSYRVTVGLTDSAVEIGAGTTGSVAILTGRAREALSVPTSAVGWEGDTAVVRVVGADGAAETTQVTIGVIGTEWVEVLDGLDAGAEVVVADLDDPLPGAASDTGQEQQQQPGGFVGGPGGGGRFGPAGG